jgi:hypothetical protein
VWRSLKENTGKFRDSVSSFTCHNKGSGINENIWAPLPRPIRHRSVARRSLWASMSNSETVSSSSVRFLLLPCSFPSACVCCGSPFAFNTDADWPDTRIGRSSVGQDSDRRPTWRDLGGSAHRFPRPAASDTVPDGTRWPHLQHRTPAGTVPNRTSSPCLFCSQITSLTSLVSGPYPLTPILFSIFSPWSM